MKHILLPLFVLLLLFPLLASAMPYDQSMVPHYGLLTPDMRQLVDMVYTAAELHQTTVHLPSRTPYDDANNAVSFVVSQYP